jgi:DNA-binding GntR family transcriptional regulator
MTDETLGELKAHIDYLEVELSRSEREQASLEDRMEDMTRQHERELDAAFADGAKDTLADLCDMIEEIVNALKKGDKDHAAVICNRVIRETNSNFVIRAGDFYGGLS